MHEVYIKNSKIIKPVIAIIFLNLACIATAKSETSNLVSNHFSASDISSGNYAICAIHFGKINCWGIRQGAVIPEVVDPISISSGSGFNCALDNLGVISCWGDNEYGQIDVPILNSPQKIVTGYSHACAIDEGKAICWGDNEYGQTDVPNIKNVTEIAAGNDFSCAIAQNILHCWGNNDFGQLNIPTLDSPRVVTAGGSHACALDSRGVVCWGRNHEGQTNAPQNLNVLHIDAGNNATCVSDGITIQCIGSFGRFHANSPGNFGSIKKISVGSNSACAINNDDYAICWGGDEAGDLSFIPSMKFIKMKTSHFDGYINNCGVTDRLELKCFGSRNSPVISNAPHLQNVTDFGVSIESACAIRDDKSLICWGSGNIPKDTIEEVTQFELAPYHGCALKSNNEVVCWGLGYDQGSIVVPFLNKPTNIALGLYHSCALTADGIKCWGSNSRGQLNVPNLINPSQIVATGFSSCADSNISEVVCWGDRGTWQIPKFNNLTSVVFGYETYCGLDNNIPKCWATTSSPYTKMPTFFYKDVFTSSKSSICASSIGKIDCQGVNKFGQFSN